jgi:8-oxo-dGTP diphosphatase
MEVIIIMNHKLATLAYLIYESQAQVLLLFRNKKKNDFHEGKYVGVGGRLEPGETPLECIMREIEEETGYTLTSKEIDYRGYLYFDEINRDKANEDLPAFNWLVFIYSAQINKKTHFKNSEGELSWFEFNQIPYEEMWEGDRIFTPKILETSDIIQGKFLYDGKMIFSWTMD